MPTPEDCEFVAFWHHAPEKRLSFAALSLICTLIHGINDPNGTRRCKTTSITLKTRENRTMKGTRGVIIVTAIVATAVVLGACRRHTAPPPMKLGAADTVVELAVRV
jgi:hypothetical protein